MEKFKKGEGVLLIKNDSTDVEDVTIITENHPMYTIQKSNHIMSAAHFNNLMSFEEYYNIQDQSYGRASFSEGDATGVPDIPIPKCTCSSYDLFHFGCKCGGE